MELNPLLRIKLVNSVCVGLYTFGNRLSFSDVVGLFRAGTVQCGQNKFIRQHQREGRRLLREEGR